MEQATPLYVLKELSFSVASLASMHKPGSYEKRLAEDAARGIRDRIDWIIACLEKSGHGNQGYPFDKCYQLVKGE
jgi:hypothetical protein